MKYPTALVMKHSRGRLLLFSSEWRRSSSMSQFTTRSAYRLCTGKKIKSKFEEENRRILRVGEQRVNLQFG